MKTLHHALVLFISTCFQTVISAVSVRDNILQNGTSNDVLTYIFRETRPAKYSTKAKHSTLLNIKEHVEEQSMEVFASPSHKAFVHHHSKLIFNGPNITNCIWSIYEGTSNLHLECKSIQITEVAGNIPNNITSLHFQKCPGSSNLSDPALDHLTMLQELGISMSSVNYISSKFLDGLVNLRILRLNGNLLSSLEPLLFQHVPNLRLLDLRGNAFLNVQNVAVSASILTNLTVLELDNNVAIKKILPEDFNLLRNTSLEVLSLLGCDMQIVAPDALKPLIHLKSLFLSNTLINRTTLNNISSSLSRSNLEILQLRNLTSVFPDNTFITEELKPLTSTNLTLLDLDSNSIFRLRDFAFPKLKSLKKLRLNNCSLIYVSYKAFHELTNLKELFLTHNKLGTIMFQLPGLHVLDLASNMYGKKYTDGTKSFDLADHGFVHFVKLRRFTLRKSDYKGPITKHTLQGLISLERLEISNTFLNHISEFAFSDLRNLKHLILSSNCLQNLTSKMFVGLGNLTKLHLSHNIIEYISNSDVFWPLTSLEILSLRDNIISRLPINLFSFNLRIHSVLLSKNILTAWDYDITSRNNALRTLLLDNNSIDDVTPQMLNLFRDLEVLDLSANIFKCNTCDMKRFRDWILDSGNTTIQKLNASFENYMCTNSDDISTPILNTTFPEELCRIKPRQTVLIACLSVMAVVVMLGVFCVYKLRLQLCDIIRSIRNRLNSYREFKITMNNGRAEIESVN